MSVDDAPGDVPSDDDVSVDGASDDARKRDASVDATKSDSPNGEDVTIDDDSSDAQPRPDARDGGVNDVANDDDAMLDITAADMTTFDAPDAARPEDPTCPLPAPAPTECGRSPDRPVVPTVDCFRPKHDLVTGLDRASRLRVDGQGVYWVSGENLMMLPTGATMPETIAPVVGAVDYTTDEEAFYFGRRTVGPDIDGSATHRVDINDVSIALTDKEVFLLNSVTLMSIARP